MNGLERPLIDPLFQGTERNLPFSPLTSISNCAAVPEIIDEKLDYGYSLTCAFNRRGTLMATGCFAGQCVMYDRLPADCILVADRLAPRSACSTDFETRTRVKVLKGHDRPIISVR
jgi:hypothetical protein